MTDTVRTQTELLALGTIGVADSWSYQDQRDFIVSAMTYTDVQLTNAQIRALKATPVELIPAPGAGLAIVPTMIVSVFDAALGAYTNPGDTPFIALLYSDGSNTPGGTNISVSDPDPVTAGASLRKWAYSLVLAGVPLANLAIVAKSSSAVGEFGGGNAANTLSIRVYYKIVPTVPFS